MNITIESYIKDFNETHKTFSPSQLISWITMHSLVFRHAEDTVKLNWDNGYAASGQWSEAQMSKFFD